MKLNKKVLTLLVLGGLTFSANSPAETASAIDLANTCAGCHGRDGSSVGPATPSGHAASGAGNWITGRHAHLRHAFRFRSS